MSLFGNLFDLNFDGKATPFEEMMGLHIISQNDQSDFNISSSSHLARDSSQFEDLDFDELSLMDEDERNEFLQDNGYDPDDFDF